MKLQKIGDQLLRPYDADTTEWMADMPIGSVVTLAIEEKRSNDQNSLSHTDYLRIGNHTGISAHEARMICKLTIGVPILRERSKKFKAFYDLSLKQLSYTDKLAAMEFVPVTRIMSKKQMTLYLEQVRAQYAICGLL